MSNQTSRVPNPYETPLSLAELLGCAAEVLQHLHESNKRLQDHIGSALSESDFGLIEDLQILDSHGQIAFDLANCLKRLSQASANGVLPKNKPRCQRSLRSTQHEAPRCTAVRRFATVHRWIAQTTFGSSYGVVRGSRSSESLPQ